MVLIRIGGKSQCEALQEYNLSNIRTEIKKNRDLPSFIHLNRAESNNQLLTYQREISGLEEKIEFTTDTILGRELEEVICELNREHFTQLKEQPNGRTLNEKILNWLGYRSRTYADRQAAAYNSGDDDDSDSEVIVDEPEMDEELVRAMELFRIVDEDQDKNAYTRKTERRPIDFDRVVPIEYMEENGEWRNERNHSKLFKRRISKEVTKSATMTQEQAIASENINDLRPNDRWNLYRLWIKLYVQKFEEEIKDLREAYQIECLRFNGLRMQEDIEIVKTAKIIGMTTTGAAKYRHIIDGSKPKIVGKRLTLFALKSVFDSVFGSCIRNLNKVHRFLILFRLDFSP